MSPAIPDTKPISPVLLYQDEHSLRVQMEFVDEGDRDVYGHHYRITHGSTYQHLRFQDGDIEKVGPNGLTTPAVLRMLIHRTTYINELVPSEDEGRALDHLLKALAYFEHRPQIAQQPSGPIEHVTV
jgi:hypothetical protein